MAQLYFDFENTGPDTSPSSRNGGDHSTTPLNDATLGDRASKRRSEACPGDRRSVRALTSPGRTTTERAKAKDILAAVELVNILDAANRSATQAERETLARFGGFGAVALKLFPDPMTGRYRSQAWEKLGGRLKALLSPEDYLSAKRTTFNAFYTSPLVMTAMHRALHRLGIQDNALVLEPGCGIGNFMGVAPRGMRFIGIELDRTSGRIAKALYPEHDIRVEGFQDAKFPEGSVDAAIGNVPFADLKLSG